MSFEGPNITQRQGGLGRSNPSTDGVFLLCYLLPAAALPVSLTFGQVYPLLQIEDAEQLGINASLDANNHLLAHHTLSEFFRMAPESKLYFMPYTNLTTVDGALDSAAMAMAIRGHKDIKGVAIAPIKENVLELHGLVEQLQDTVEAFAADKILLDFVLVDGNANGNVITTLADYPDFRTKKAPNISVSIAQDPDVAALDDQYKNYAAIGTVLGSLAVRKVNENLGSVDIVAKPRSKRGTESYPISGTTQWLKASLSSGQSFDTLSTVHQKALTAKGYIYAGQFEGYPGVYFNNSPTCVELASDYAYIENNRTWNKVARAVREALIPKIRSVIKKDPSTGYMRATSVAALESICNGAIDTIISADEISGYDVYIDPKQVVDDAHPLAIKINIVKDDIIHEMDIDLGYAATL